jgi:Phage QLRG family, putative DNA packaging.
MEERLEKLKMLLGIEETDEDERLTFILESTEQKILNYCNLPELPAALENVLVEMAADFYDASDGVASSVQVGDTSVSYRKDEDSIIREYKGQLHRFRRVVWT